MLTISEAERLWAWKHSQLLKEFEDMLIAQSESYERVIQDASSRLPLTAENNLPETSERRLEQGDGAEDVLEITSRVRVQGLQSRV